MANVADSLLDSQIVFDYISKQDCSIDYFQLFDIDNTALRFLSASQHTYFSGNTNVNGKFKIMGGKQDSLTDVELQVLEGGQVKATAKLGSNVQLVSYK